MSGLSRNDWRTIVRRVKEGRLTPIIGDKLATGFLPGKDTFPKAWAKFVGYPLNYGLELSEIARYLIVDQGESRAAKEDFLSFNKEHLLDSIKAAQLQTSFPDDIAGKLSNIDFSSLALGLGILNFEEGSQNPLYQLARLDLPIYITTGYFGLLESALSTVGKKPHAQFCHWNDKAVSLPVADTDARPQSKISEILDQHFSIADLREISFELDIDYENLDGEVKSIKVIELIKYLTRRDRLNELLKIIQKERPNIDLSTIPLDGVQSPGLDGERAKYTLVHELDYDPKPEQPLVYHLHGLDIEPSSLVLTEDDYLDFLVKVSSDQTVLPFKIREALVDNSLLLLGYDLQDWDFRVLFRGLIAAKRGTRRGMNIAIQLEPKSQEYQGEAKRYLREYFDDLQFKVYWGNSQEFLTDLLSKMGDNQ